MLKIILPFLLVLKGFASSLEPFSLITIPKAGSHLLIKTLHYMTGFTPKWDTQPPKIEDLFLNSQFPYTHCCLSSSLLRFYENYPIKRLIGIRDLRDVCVSIVYQIRKGTWPEFTHNPINKKRFNKLTFDQQLLFVIKQEYEVEPPEINLQLGIRRVAEQVVSLMDNPNVLICRYEDLVGVQGGGSDKAQRNLLEKIGEHIGLQLNADEIHDLATHLYGNETNPFGQGDFTKYQSTFREGKIGAWKSVFKERHKKVFKERLGKYLIALGYEKDDAW